MTEHSKPVRLAHAVLLAAIDEKWPTAQRAIERLNAECGPEGLATALIAWCDAIAEHAQGGRPEFGRVNVLPWNTDTGGVGDEALRPTVRWATRLVAARAKGDIEAFEALLAELNAINDGFERGRYATELVQSAALTIRSLPRGYANMGRSS